MIIVTDRIETLSPTCLNASLALLPEANYFKHFRQTENLVCNRSAKGAS
jgi:hypothetical protein